MGIREMLKQGLGIGVENSVEHREKIVEKVVQKQGYEISAVCDTEEEITQNVGGFIGIGGDDDE